MLKTLIAGAFFGTALSFVAAQQQCNGHAEFCSKRYSELTYVLTHNSYAYTENPASTQMCDISAQLADGVRGLKLSALKTNSSSSDNTIHLCHTSCSILDAGPAVNTLSAITSWVKDNPNDILTIFWNNPNYDFHASDFVDPYTQSGLVNYSYVQSPYNTTWPTLQEIIASGKRVINFLDVNADQKNVPWLMSEFDYVFETPYDNNNESSFSCTIDRPQDPSDPSAMMYGMNHFLYGTLPFGNPPIQIPQEASADVTNSDSSLLKQANTCKQTFGRNPNFLIVDFYNKGQTLQIAAELNNVTYSNSSVLQCDLKQTTNSDSNSTSDAPHVSFSPLALAVVLFVASLAI